MDALPYCCAMLAGGDVPGGDTLGCGFAAALDWRFFGEDFGDRVVFFTARLARGVIASSRKAFNSEFISCSASLVVS